MTQIIAEKLIHELNKIEEIFHRNETTDNNTLSIRGVLLYMKEAIQASIEPPKEGISGAELWEKMKNIPPVECGHPEYEAKSNGKLKCTICGENYKLDFDEDGWIPFNGKNHPEHGPSPVHNETIIQPLFNINHDYQKGIKTKALILKWHNPNLIAYKIIKAYEEPKRIQALPSYSYMPVKDSENKYVIVVSLTSKAAREIAQCDGDDDAKLICDALNYWDENHGK